MKTQHGSHVAPLSLGNCAQDIGTSYCSLMKVNASCAGGQLCHPSPQPSLYVQTNSLSLIRLPNPRIPCQGLTRCPLSLVGSARGCPVVSYTEDFNMVPPSGDTLPFQIREGQRTRNLPSQDLASIPPNTQRGLALFARSSREQRCYRGHLILPGRRLPGKEGWALLSSQLIRTSEHS